MLVAWAITGRKSFARAMAPLERNILVLSIRRLFDRLVAILAPPGCATLFTTTDFELYARCCRLG